MEEKDQKSWEKFKKNLPNLIKEAIVFSVCATTFLLIIVYFLYKLLEVIYNI